MGYCKKCKCDKCKNEFYGMKRGYKKLVTELYRGTHSKPVYVLVSQNVWVDLSFWVDKKTRSNNVILRECEDNSYYEVDRFRKNSCGYPYMVLRLNEDIFKPEEFLLEHNLVGEYKENRHGYVIFTNKREVFEKIEKEIGFIPGIKVIEFEASENYENSEDWLGEEGYYF